MNLSLLVELFLTFLRVGALAFGGGLATLPPLEQALIIGRPGSHNWLSAVEWSDVLTISNMTPGPIAINAATFVGTKVGGDVGGGLLGRLLSSVIATLGSILPQFLIMSVLAYLLWHGHRLPALDYMIKGLRPGVVGLIAAVTLRLFFQDLFPLQLEPQGVGVLTSLQSLGLTNLVDWIAVATFLLSLLAFWKKIDLLKMLGIGALLGLLMEWIL